MGVGVFVGVWTARYLGPVQFGALNYANAIVAIFVTVSSLGMDNIVIKEIVETPSKSKKMLSAVFTLRLMISILFFVAASFIMFFGEHVSLGIILCGTLLFSPLNTIDLLFQSKVLSKYTVIAQNVAFFVVAILRVALIMASASLEAFGIALLIESMLSGVFLYLIFRRVTDEKLSFKIDFSVAMFLLKKSWPLVFSSLMIVIYMKIDQIMIGQMIGDYEVGVYSSALRLSEIWYFVPVVICNSFYPSFILAKNTNEELYRQRIQKLLTLLFIISLPLSLLFSVFSEPIITLLFGESYGGAGLILSIHIWTAIFVFSGVGGSIFFVIEDLHKKTFARSVLGALLNIALNLVLIPKFMAMGAAIATLVTQIFSSYLFDFFSEKTRPLFIMKTKAFIGYDVFKFLYRKSAL